MANIGQIPVCRYRFFLILENADVQLCTVVWYGYLSDLRYLYTVMFGVESDLVLMDNFTMFNWC